MWFDIECRGMGTLDHPVFRSDRFGKGFVDNFGGFRISALLPNSVSGVTRSSIPPEINNLILESCRALKQLTECPFLSLDTLDHISSQENRNLAPFFYPL